MKIRFSLIILALAALIVLLVGFDRPLEQDDGRATQDAEKSLVMR